VEQGDSTNLRVPLVQIFLSLPQFIAGSKASFNISSEPKNFFSRGLWEVRPPRQHFHCSFLLLVTINS
jgi:hypothetical protein